MSRFTLSACLMLSVVPALAQAGWPFFSDGPRRGTPEYWQYHAGRPVGDRQECHHGRLWPPEARPTGEPAPLIHRFHHNLYWPHPYNCADRQVVDQIQQTQVSNGWQEATTLYDYHFDPVTQELNSAGRDHLFWIMSSAPAEFRTMYVQTSRMDPSINDTRLATVQSEATRFVGTDQSPPIMLRVAQPRGTPAADVNAVFEYRRGNLSPPPTVQYTAGSSGGGGGTQ